MLTVVPCGCRVAIAMMSSCRCRRRGRGHRRSSSMVSLPYGMAALVLMYTQNYSHVSTEALALPERPSLPDMLHSRSEYERRSAT